MKYVLIFLGVIIVILESCSQVRVLVKSVIEDAGPGVKGKATTGLLKRHQSSLTVGLSERAKEKLKSRR
jgi:hypothetical protein